MQPSKLLHWSRSVYLLGLFFIILFLIPTQWFPLQLGKLFAFGICIAVAFILYCADGSTHGLTKGAGFRSALLVLALPLAYLISWFFSIDQSVGIAGYAIEPDTLLFVVLAFVTFMTSYALFRTLHSARSLLRVVTVLAIVAAAFQYLLILFGTTLIPFSVFSDRSVNLVGKWNDLGLLLGLAVLLLIVWVEFVGSSRRNKILTLVLAALLTLLLAIIQFPLVWTLLLCFFLLLCVASFVSKRWNETAPQRWHLRAVPWVPLAGAALSALFLMWGSVFNVQLTSQPNSIFRVSSLEVRPAFSSTLDITKAAHGSSIHRFLVGTGPNTFGENWLLFKPTSVNQSPFWNLDFTVGFSTFMTALESVGLLGALAWLIPLLLVFLGFLRAIRSPLLLFNEKILALSLSLGAIYLWCAILFYVPSQNLILLAFVLAGAAYGFCMRQPQTHGEEGEGATSPAAVSSRSFWVVAAVIVVLLLWFGTVAARRVIAESYTNQGNVVLNQGSAQEALALASRAEGVEVNSDDLRLAALAGVTEMQQIVSSATTPTTQQQAAFASLASTTIGVAKEGITMGPHDYRDYVALARIYDLLASLNVNGAYQSAGQVYQAASALDPSDPQIPLLISRLAAVHGDLQNTQTFLARSLTLKPDYTDAILLLVQLDVANKDIPSAIQAAQAAVKSAPGVQSIWFELGLLYYTANDTKDAIPALEQAIQLESDYANAKYFLGLSYAAQGQMQNAIAQFQDLSQSNPDNAEVTLILNNLEAGKSPFAGAEPPVTSTPQNRPTAPISQ